MLTYSRKSKDSSSSKMNSLRRFLKRASRKNSKNKMRATESVSLPASMAHTDGLEAEAPTTILSSSHESLNPAVYKTRHTQDQTTSTSEVVDNSIDQPTSTQSTEPLPEAGAPEQASSRSLSARRKHVPAPLSHYQRVKRKISPPHNSMSMEKCGNFMEDSSSGSEYRRLRVRRLDFWRTTSSPAMEKKLVSPIEKAEDENKDAHTSTPGNTGLPEIPTSEISWETVYPDLYTSFSGSGFSGSVPGLSTSSSYSIRSRLDGLFPITPHTPQNVSMSTKLQEALSTHMPENESIEQSIRLEDQEVTGSSSQAVPTSSVQKSKPTLAKTTSSSTSDGTAQVMIDTPADMDCLGQDESEQELQSFKKRDLAKEYPNYFPKRYEQGLETVAKVEAPMWPKRVQRPYTTTDFPKDFLQEEQNKFMRWRKFPWMRDYQVEWLVDPKEPEILLTIKHAIIELGGDLEHIHVEVLERLPNFSQIYFVQTLKHGRPIEYVLRLVAPVDPYYKTESEVATMEYARHFTTIPVPQVFFYDSSTNNPVGMEWILMEKASGVPFMDSQYFLDTGNDMNRKIALQLAQWNHELGKLQLSKIGSLYMHWSAGELQFKLGRLVAFRGAEFRELSKDIPRGPYSSLEEYYRALLQLNILNTEDSELHRISLSQEERKELYYTDGDMATPQEADNQDLYQRIGFPDAERRQQLADGANAILRELPQLLRWTWYEKLPAMLHHPDLAARNIMHDGKGNITAVLDWERCGVVPAVMVNQVPEIIETEEDVEDCYSTHSSTWKACDLDDRGRSSDNQNSEWTVYECFDSRDNSRSRCDAECHHYPGAKVKIGRGKSSHRSSKDKLNTRYDAISHHSSSDTAESAHEVKACFDSDASFRGPYLTEAYGPRDNHSLTRDFGWRSAFKEAEDIVKTEMRKIYMDQVRTFDCPVWSKLMEFEPCKEELFDKELYLRICSPEEQDDIAEWVRETVGGEDEDSNTDQESGDGHDSVECKDDSLLVTS